MSIEVYPRSSIFQTVEPEQKSLSYFVDFTKEEDILQIFANLPLQSNAEAGWKSIQPQHYRLFKQATGYSPYQYTIKLVLVARF